MYSLVLNKNGMGTAPQALSQTLVKSYFTLLLNEEQLPSAICCYGEGVFLCCSGSPILEELRKLQERGCMVLVCKTCLNFFEQTDDIAVGSISTMMEIMGIQIQCDKVITL